MKPTGSRTRRGLAARASALVCRLIAKQPVRTALYEISPVLLARLRYRIAWGRWPDLRHPRTLDEKLVWLMLYWRHPLKTLCADKYAVRGWLERKGLGAFLPALLGVWDNAADIDFRLLPEQFVLKCSHGCGMNLFRRRGESFDTAAARLVLQRWLAEGYAERLGEIHYRGVRRRVIAEELLVDPEYDPPLEYKIWCFNGVAQFTIVCSGRTGTGAADYDVFDRDWRRRLDLEPLHDFPRPAAYAEMLAVAERIAEPFPFVRVDLYWAAGRIVIGEVTFTPSGCIDEWLTSSTGPEEAGSLIRLPEPLPG